MQYSEGLCARVCVYKYGRQQGYTELAIYILHNCETARFVQYFFAQAVRQEGYTVCERWDWKILTLGSASPYPRAERKTFQCTSFQKVLGPSTKTST